MNFRSLIPHVVSITLSCVCVSYGQPKKSAGFVNNAEGNCWLQRASAKGQITAVHKGTDLTAGDKVRCDKGGRLNLRTTKSARTQTTIDPSDHWTTIRAGNSSQTDPMARPIDDWFKLAGAPRAGSLAWVYSPPGASPGSAAWPANLVVRWIPQGTTGNISMSIRDESGNPLWPLGKERRITVPASAGELTAVDMREALLAYRASGREGPLTLVLVNPEGDESSIKFSVISVAQEDSLQRQLMVCDGQDGLLRYICRAYEFRQLRMYTEAAEVYDTALREFAPDSVDLMLHAIAAHQLTGNYRREEILAHQLPPGAKAPE